MTLVIFVVCTKVQNLSSFTTSCDLQPDVNPGNCWAFKGSKGFLGIRLSMRIVPTAVSLEHIPKALAPSGTLLSAPRDFSIYVRWLPVASRAPALLVLTPSCVSRVWRTWVRRMASCWGRSPTRRTEKLCRRSTSAWVVNEPAAGGGGAANGPVGQLSVLLLHTEGVPALLPDGGAKGVVQLGAPGLHLHLPHPRSWDASVRCRRVLLLTFRIWTSVKTAANAPDFLPVGCGHKCFVSGNKK